MELVMYLSLILVLFELFFNLSLEDLVELRLEQHLVNGDEYLKNHLEYLTLCKLEPNSIRDHYLVVNQLVSMKVD